jgi:hypothetical protein
MPDKRPSVKNERQYEALKDKGMSKERAARIANSPGVSSRGGKKSGSGGNSKQGGTTAQKKAAGRKGARPQRGRSHRSREASPSAVEDPFGAVEIVWLRRSGSRPDIQRGR